MNWSDFKPDPQNPGYHYRDGKYAREMYPSWIIEEAKKREESTSKPEKGLPDPGH